MSTEQHAALVHPHFDGAPVLVGDEILVQHWADRPEWHTVAEVRWVSRGQKWIDSYGDDSRVWLHTQEHPARVLVTSDIQGHRPSGRTTVPAEALQVIADAQAARSNR